MMEQTRSARRRVLALATGAVGMALLGLGPPAGAQTSWTSWNMTTPGNPGTATGTVSTNGGTVNVSYTGQVLSGSQTSNAPGAMNFWTPTSTFGGVNAPTNAGIIQLQGGTGLTNTLTFSSPVQSVFLSVLSLGAGSNPVTYNFNMPFSIVSQGASTAYGGCSTCLTMSGNSLSGTEGNGLLMFSGPITTLSWTVTGSEYWHGFTVGVGGASVSTVPEPSSLALLGTGLVSLVPMVRRKRT